MERKGISSPQKAAYPLTVKKAFVAPDESLEAGQLIYEIEDSQKRRLEIKCPLAGSVFGPVLAPGTRLASPAIILEVRPTQPQETVEAWADTAAPKAAATQQKPSANPRSERKENQSAWLPLLGFVISPLLLWIALHITHSLAPSTYRFGAPVLAIIAPWLIYLMLPGKDRDRSPAVNYGGALLLGNLLSVVLFVATLFLPARVLAMGDSQAIHRLVSPITYAPMLEVDDRLYLLGQEIEPVDYHYSVPLSNGGLIGCKISFIIEGDQTGQIWLPNGKLGPKLESFRIRVYADEDAETMIATYPFPHGPESWWETSEFVWTRSLYSNAGDLLETVEDLPARPDDDKTLIPMDGTRLPVPESAVRLAERIDPSTLATRLDLPAN